MSTHWVVVFLFTLFKCAKISILTEPLNEYPEFEINDPSQRVPGIQCSLCLHEITLPGDSTEAKSRGWVQCPRCEYHQPLSKIPRGRDLAIFGGVIGAVYITTIVAVLLMR